MRLPPNRIDGKRVAASSLDHRTAGFKLGDGREYQKPAKHVSRLSGKDCVAQELNPIGLIYLPFVGFRVYLEGISRLFRQRGHLTLLPLKFGGIFSFRPQAQVRNMN